MGDVEQGPAAEQACTPGVAVLWDLQASTGGERDRRAVSQLDGLALGGGDRVPPGVALEHGRPNRHERDDGGERDGAPDPAHRPGRSVGAAGGAVGGAGRGGGRARLDGVGPGRVEGLPVGPDPADGAGEAGVRGDGGVEGRARGVHRGALVLRQEVVVGEGVEDEELAVREVARETGADLGPQRPPAGKGLGEAGAVGERRVDGGPVVGTERVVEGEGVDRVAHGKRG